MAGYAAAGDTWGISGPEFLGLYILAAVLALVGALVLRAMAKRSSPSGSTLSQPGPLEIAYLNGGPQLAMYAALAALRTNQAVDAGPGGALTALATPSTPIGELEWAIYTAAGRGTRQRDLAKDPGVAGALDRMRDNLERGGWLLSSERRGQVRQGAYVMFVVAAVGVARLLAGIANDKPVGFLVAAVVAVAVVGLLLRRTPKVTGQTRGLLASMRRSNHHLSPSQEPSWALYGAGGAALGVGLFGAGALYAADPAFADAAELQRNQSLTTGSSGGSSDGGSSSSSSGSSCGGGSGCGGGGGCGG